MTKLNMHLISLCLFGFLSISCSYSGNTEIKKTADVNKINKETKKPTTKDDFPHVIKRNIPLYTHLTKLEVPSLDIIEMVKAAKKIKNLSRLLPGMRFQIFQGKNKELLEAKFRFSPLESLHLKKTEDKWNASLTTEEVEIKTISFKGEVETSLWESATEAQMDPYLITNLAEIFGWEVDFNREVRKHDQWRLTAEKKLVKGTHVGWGSILAAEYINKGISHKAILFRDENKNIGYYNESGENLRKMFLKSPLRFGRVTSRFNKRRFHPKLRIIRPHNGVDYGAPRGTPVRSVADGKVTFARRSGGGGKVLKIRHNSTYKTAYKHLSRYGKKIRVGAKVKQGQIVAYTGNTGLSTGPHLHYEFFVNNRFVDPLKQKFPSAEPLASKYKTAFKLQSKTRLRSLPKWKPKNFIQFPQNTLAKEITPKFQENFVLTFEPEA